MMLLIASLYLMLIGCAFGQGNRKELHENFCWQYISEFLFFIFIYIPLVNFYLFKLNLVRIQLSNFSFFFTSVFLKTKNMTSIRWVLSRLRQVMLKMCLLTIFFNVLENKFFKFFLETNLFNIFVTICFSECLL